MEKRFIKGYALTDYKMFGNSSFWWWKLIIRVNWFDEKQLNQWLKNNPAMFYNHNSEVPVWSWTKIEKTTKEIDWWEVDALYIEWEVTNNIDIEWWTKLFDLIDNKSLRWLSITNKVLESKLTQNWVEVWWYDEKEWWYYCFDNIDFDKAIDEEITKSEIIEVSLVTIPNNIESTFEKQEVTSKEEQTQENAKKWELKNNYKDDNTLSKNINILKNWFDNWLKKVIIKSENKNLILNNYFILQNDSNMTIEELAAKLEELAAQFADAIARIEAVEWKIDWVKDEVKADLVEEVKDTVVEEAKTDVKDAIVEEAKAEVIDATKEEIKTEVAEEVKDAVVEEVKDEVETIKEEVKDEIKKEINSFKDEQLNVYKNKLKEIASKQEVNSFKKEAEVKTVSELFGR